MKKLSKRTSATMWKRLASFGVSKTAIKSLWIPATSHSYGQSMLRKQLNSKFNMSSNWFGKKQLNFLHFKQNGNLPS